MKDKRLISIVAIIVLLGIGMVIFLNSSSNSKKVSKKEISKIEYSSSDWRKNYSLENLKPMGLFIFKELIWASEKVQEFNEYSNYKLLDSILSLDSSFYMFIGKDFTFTHSETLDLLESIKNGNHLFLSLEEMPFYLFARISLSNKIQYYQQKKAIYKSNHSQYEQYNLFETDTLTGFWDVFKINQEQELVDFKIITELNDYPVFISINHGKGKIFLHLNPITFVNYQLLREDGKNYLTEFLNTVEKPNIQWLSFAEYEPVPYDESSGEFRPNILFELFKHPAFRWGFIFAIIGILLYFLFRSKRKEPVIPPIVEHKNTGFSYVDTLAGIYYDKNHAEKILKIMQTNFYNAVYDHFYIDLNKDVGEKSLEKLAGKTKVSIEVIKKLVNRLNTSTKISQEYLSETYQLQRSFYFLSGIWSEEDKNKIREKPVYIFYKKEHVFTLIGVGIVTIATGFFALSFAMGLGVLFWPLGIFLIYVGVQRLSRPLITQTSDYIEIMSFWGENDKIPIENIKFISKTNRFYQIELNNGTLKKINWQNLEKQNLFILEKLVNKK